MTAIVPLDTAAKRHAGLAELMLLHRVELLRFLLAHGAGDAAEDFLQELWIKVSTASTGPIPQPLSYLYRAANNLMIDRYRSRRQAEGRDRDWSNACGADDTERSDQPGAEREIMGREALIGAQAAVAALGTRAATIFRRYRLDGVAQRDIAAELGVSLSTVESDLRRTYRALVDYRRTLDEG